MRITQPSFIRVIERPEFTIISGLLDWEVTKTLRIRANPGTSHKREGANTSATDSVANLITERLFILQINVHRY